MSEAKAKPPVPRTNLDHQHYQDIENGKKTIEGRLYRDKWCSMEKGDTLVFGNRETQEELTTTITDIKHYLTFEDMLDQEDADQILPSTPDQDRLKVYHEIYSEDQRLANTIIAIHIKLID